MPLFLCDREFVSDQRWRVDMNEFYEELKKVLDLSDGDVWTETVLCGKDAGKKRILSGIFAQDEEQNERPDEKKKENKFDKPKKADVKARAESSVNESEEFPVL